MTGLVTNNSILFENYNFLPVLIIFAISIYIYPVYLTLFCLPSGSISSSFLLYFNFCIYMCIFISLPSLFLSQSFNHSNTIILQVYKHKYIISQTRSLSLSMSFFIYLFLSLSPTPFSPIHTFIHPSLTLCYQELIPIFDNLIFSFTFCL